MRYDSDRDGAYGPRAFSMMERIDPRLGKKKGLGKIFKAALPMITSLAGGALNAFIPGAGNIVQGLTNRFTAKSVKDVGTNQASAGVGEILAQLLGGRSLFTDADQKAAIQQQLGQAPPGEAPSPAGIGGGALAGAGAGFLVANVPGAIVGGVLGAGAGVAGVVDKAYAAITGKKVA